MRPNRREIGKIREEDESNGETGALYSVFRFNQQNTRRKTLSWKFFYQQVEFQR